MTVLRNATYCLLEPAVRADRALEQWDIDPPWVAIPSGLDGRRIVGDAGFAMASEPERKRR